MPRVEPDDLAPAMDEGPPPELLDIVFQLDAQWAVIPGVGQTAVDIGTGKDKTAPFAERDDLFHCGAARGAEVLINICSFPDMQSAGPRLSGPAVAQ